MLDFHMVNESFMWGVTIVLKRINLGFFLEIKALMVNLIHENKNFLKAPFRSSQRNGMELNDHKGMERNEMYLSKGKEWKRIEWNGIKQPWLDVLK